MLLIGILPAHAADQPIEIDVILSPTGPSAFTSHSVATMLAAAVSWINSTGGVKGQTVHFVVQDDQANPATALELANQDSPKASSRLHRSGK